MISDLIKIKVNLKITVTNPEGKIKQEVEVPNLVVTTGKNFIASRMKDASATAMTHMAIGTGSTSAAAGNTALGSEAGLLNASSSGTLLCRTVFSVINKASGDTLGITWTVTVS